MGYMYCCIHAGDTEGGQAGSIERRRRTRLTTTQMCFLPERHRPHVPLPVSGENHTVSGCHASFLA